MHHSEDFKIQAVKHYIKIKHLSKVATIFNVSRRSIKRWYQKYKKNKRILNIKRYGSYKVKNKYIEEIKNILKERPDIYIRKIHKKLKEKFPDYNIHENYLYSIIRDNNITRKRRSHIHFPKVSYGKIRDRNEELKIFFNKLNNYNMDKIISIDETSLRGGLSQNYTYCKLGKRCFVKTDDNLIFKKYTCVVAINNKKTIKYKMYNKGGMTSERFVSFLKEFLPNMKNHLIVLDNGGMHKTNEVKDYIRSTGNDYLYILPYHHYLNPIEEYFNQLKHYIKLDKPLTFGAIENSIIESIKKIKEVNYKNYFLHAYDMEKLKKKKFISTKKKKLKKYKD